MWDKAVLLRPHHGLCLAHFMGEGYSGPFAENMGQVLSDLTAENPLVRLCCRVDGICAVCPERRGGACQTAAQVADYDRAVLALCAVGEGTELPFLDFARLVQEHIIAPGRRREVCGGCRWEDLCDRVDSRWAKLSPPCGTP